MILYNVTVNIEDSVHHEWLEWMRNKHVPDVMNTGIFLKSKICKVLNTEEDGTTYSFQYFCRSMEDFEKYRSEYAPALQEEVNQRYRNKFVAFRTLLEVIDENWTTEEN